MAQNVLSLHQNQWSIEVGDAWIFAGIETRLTFKLTTAIKFTNLTRRVQLPGGTFRHEIEVCL